jgi:hypothetical protein
MTNFINHMTAQTPSGFDAPACNHAYAVAATTGLIAIEGALGSVVRDRQAIATGLMAHAEKSFPGTTAWRPPTS